MTTLAFLRHAQKTMQFIVKNRLHRHAHIAHKHTHGSHRHTHTHTHTRIAHKHTHGLHTNAHTDCTQTHTYFYRWSFSPLKQGRKHTHTCSENPIFGKGGLPWAFQLSKHSILAPLWHSSHKKKLHFWHLGRFSHQKAAF